MRACLGLLLGAVRKQWILLRVHTIHTRYIYLSNLRATERERVKETDTLRGQRGHVIFCLSVSAQYYASVITFTIIIVIIANLVMGLEPTRGQHMCCVFLFVMLTCVVSMRVCVCLMDGRIVVMAFLLWVSDHWEGKKPPCTHRRIWSNCDYNCQNGSDTFHYGLYQEDQCTSLFNVLQQNCDIFQQF